MVRCSVGRGKKTSSGLPLIEYVPSPGLRITRATAVLRLPVAGLRAPAGGVDGPAGDRLGEVLVAVGGVAGVLVVLAVEVLAAQGLLALPHDVDLEVGAGDQRLL